MFRPLLIYAFALMAALFFLPDAQASSISTWSSLSSTSVLAPQNYLILEPGQGAFVSGEQSSCVDLMEAKATKSAAKKSVEPQGFALESLKLNWTSSNILNVDSIRAVVSDLAGNRAVLEMPADEVMALLAHEQASIQGPAVVVTNDPARNADPKFVPCGLSFGGINWIDSTQDLNVTLTVVGTVETPNGDLSPLEVSVATVVKP